MHIAKYEEFREIKKGMKVAYMFGNELKLTRTIADSYYNFDSDEKGWEVETADCVLCLGDVYIPEEHLYVVGHTCDFTHYYRMNKVKMQDNDKVFLLNTDLMLEQAYSKYEIEELIQNNPDIQIAGMVHDENAVTELYGFPRISTLLTEGNVAVYFEQITDRGNFLKLKVYTRDGETKPEKINSTGHVNGRWDFDLDTKDVEESENSIKVTLEPTLRDKNRSTILDDIVIEINENEKTYKIVRQPDEKQLSAY